ncbi:prenyltransferase/squalene oxidase repeat-containing protein [Rhodopirellula islandica]|nr:prenyltransferase/squalene oxidase repeat-containing protein [Rhodopirellula islandica]
MPSWLVSLVAHLAVLLGLALISRSAHQTDRIELQFRQSDDPVADELVEFSIASVAPLDALETSIEEDQVDIEALDSFALIEISDEIFSAVPKLDADLFDPTVSSTSSVAKPENMFEGRRGAMKQKLLRRYGGDQATEDAVSAGLVWLKRQQLRNGSWSLHGPYANGARGENQTSATAMAMLAFMGAGSTHRGGPYQKELLRAARWLVAKQDRQGFLAGSEMGHERMYSQAQATIALCELYAMTGDSWIRPYAQSACDFAVASQSPQGGWRYQPRMDSDTSVTGWFVMGLKSGDAGGLEVDPYIWPKIERYFDSVSQGYTGGYSYMPNLAASPAMTAEGVLCHQYLGRPRTMPGMAQSLDTLVQNHPVKANEADVYYWYYATQALHHYGGPLWNQWNEEMKATLPARQEKRGREHGSWSPTGDAWGGYAGRLYTTCLSIYCLEVYYRHLPLYDHAEVD